MNNSILIHANNIPENIKIMFSDTSNIFFNYTNKDSKSLHEYIHSRVISKLIDGNFDIIYIKDNLSSNYLELYGLLVAYHIRLTQALKNTRFVPIVILSDIDGFFLVKLEPIARILLTKNVFLEKNTKNTVERYKQIILKPLTKKEYKNNFLNLIEVESPENSNNHSIANKWAIYRWSKFLDVKDSDVLAINREKISSMLYFKYLLANNYNDENLTTSSCTYPIFGGNVLYIDDEWNKGWSDILDSYFDETPHIKFETLKCDYDEKNVYKLVPNIKNKIQKNHDPDIVILDLRFTVNDHKDINRKNIDNYTGIKIREVIKEISPAIQVIIFSATSKSVILEKLYAHNILGYIKKEHPDDKNLSTEESVDKLAELVGKGMEKKYLKEVWNISEKILKLSPPKEIKLEVKSVFEILNSNMDNKFNYSMFAIFKCIEIITSLYIEEKDRKAYWTGGSKITNTGYYPERKEYNTSNLEHIASENKKYYKNTGNISIENKIRTIMREKLDLESLELHSDIKCLVCVRNHTMHQDKKYGEKDFCKQVVAKKVTKENILTWFKMLQTIIKEL